MLRHTGNKRNYKHNIRLASMLCLTAGFVNVSGLLGFMVLTTNVTGHAAIFAEKLSRQDYRQALGVGLWMLLFFAGAFFSSLYIARVGQNNRLAYTVPIIVEITILVLVGSLGYTFDKTTIKTDYFAGSLLFAMGMQNAMVTVISGFVVRTTHLTGMFTDLGIELASLVHDRKKRNEMVRHKIALRLVIIFFFLLGGVLGGYIFQKLRYHTFYIPAGILLVVMFYNSFRFRALKILHNFKSK
jgi:uncharacterized membrane protein YoaK (UPF0700 family)